MILYHKWKKAYLRHAVKHRQKLKMIKLCYLTSWYQLIASPSSCMCTCWYITHSTQLISLSFHYSHPKAVIILFYIEYTFIYSRYCDETVWCNVWESPSMPPTHHDFLDTPLLHLACSTFHPNATVLSSSTHHQCNLVFDWLLLLVRKRKSQHMIL